MFIYRKSVQGGIKIYQLVEENEAREVMISISNFLWLKRIEPIKDRFIGKPFKVEFRDTKTKHYLNGRKQIFYIF